MIFLSGADPQAQQRVVQVALVSAVRPVQVQFALVLQPGPDHRTLELLLAKGTLASQQARERLGASLRPRRLVGRARRHLVRLLVRCLII